MRFPLPKECHNKGVNATVLDDKVWSMIVDLLSNRKLIEEHFEIWKRKQDNSPEDSQFLKDKLKRQLDTYDEQENRYLKAYGEGVITLEQYKERLYSIKNSKDGILSKLQQLSSTSSLSDQMVIMPDLEEYCKKMIVVLKNRNFEKKLLIVRKVISKVATDGKIAKIQGYIPLQIPVEENKKNVKFKTECRHCRIAQCREINAV